MDTLYSREAAEEGRSRARREDARLCATCHWHRASAGGWQADLCLYPLMPWIVKQRVLEGMIRGEDPTIKMLCSTARDYENECGRDAKYWKDADDGE